MIRQLGYRYRFEGVKLKILTIIGCRVLSTSFDSNLVLNPRLFSNEATVLTVEPSERTTYQVCVFRM